MEFKDEIFFLTGLIIKNKGVIEGNMKFLWRLLEKLKSSVVK